MPPSMPDAPDQSGPPKSSVARRMGLLSAGTLLSRVLGMARETLIAAAFPLGATDAFFIAWRIPNALRALLAEGALSSAFVPVFSEALRRGPRAFTLRTGDEPQADEGSRHDALREAISRIRAASLLVLIPLSALGVLFAEPVLRATAGDFNGDRARFTLAVSLLRWLFPYIFFMGTAAVGIGALQSVGRVAALAFAPALLNVAFLLAPAIFVPVCVRAGLPAIHGLAFAALLGGLLQLLALVPALHRAGLRPRPVLDLRHPAVRRAGALLAPGIFGLAIYQIDVVLSNRFLSSLPTGAASYFNYAQRLADIPQGVFILAVSNAFLPELAGAFAAGDRAKASELLTRMVRIAAFVAVPVAAVLATYGEAVVPLIYGYGRFRLLGSAGVAEVVRSLRWQAGNVALLALVRQFTATYAAAQDPRGPVWISFVDLLAFVALAWALRGPMGHAGVAAAIAGSTLVVVGVRRHVSPDWRSLAKALLRIVAASVPPAVAAVLLTRSVDFARPGLGVRFVAVGGGVALGAVYVLAAWMLRVEEVRVVAEMLRRRLRRR